MEIILQQKCSDFQKYFSSKVSYTVLLHSNWSFSKEALWRGMVWLERKTPPPLNPQLVHCLFLFFVVPWCTFVFFSQIVLKKMERASYRITLQSWPHTHKYAWPYLMMVMLKFGVIASSAPTSFFFFFLLNCNQISLMWCITNYWGCSSKHDFALSFFPSVNSSGIQSLLPLVSFFYLLLTRYQKAFQLFCLFLKRGKKKIQLFKIHTQ